MKIYSRFFFFKFPTNERDARRRRQKLMAERSRTEGAARRGPVKKAERSRTEGAARRGPF